MTLAGLKGISRSFSELSTQFKMVSISDAIKRKIRKSYDSWILFIDCLFFFCIYL